MPNRFLSGFVAPFKALALLLRRQDLWQYLILPVLVNLFILISLLFIGYHRFYAPMVASREGWSVVAVSLGLGLLLVVMGGLLFFILAGIVGAPFYDRMSEKVEQEAFLNHSHLLAAPMGFYKSALHASWESMRRWGIAGLFIIALALLNLMPVVGTLLSGALGFLLGGLFLTLDALSYPLDRRHYTLRDKLLFMRSRSSASSGLAVGLLLLYAIPCAWLIAPPIAALSGTLLYCELKRGGSQS